ncbi:MAG: hypothetical protein U0794_06145 [Isosphaeraceae bacterium]
MAYRGSWPSPNGRELLAAILAAIDARPAGWPEQFDARVEGWLRATLRFARTDGSPAFGRLASQPRLAPLYRRWAERLADPGITTVLDWWFPPRTPTRHAPPPLPADARPDRPLAVLRANWLRDGDFVAVSHCRPGLASQLELFAAGRPWIGPDWTTPCETGRIVSRARPTLWLTHSAADLAEWSFRVGPAQVTRTVVLLRGRKLALLSEQWDGAADPGQTTWQLAPGLETRCLSERGLVITAPRTRVAPEVIPFTLPRLDQPGEAGQLVSEGGALVLHRTSGQRRTWRPLLVSWDPLRGRKKLEWRTLTVTEDRKPCGPGTAVAARVTWGRNETLLIYRSLNGPATRAFLGHQTRARFLIALFDENGEVEPLVKVD